MSLFKFKRYIACFVDENGDYVGKKVISRSLTLGQDKRVFYYNDGAYNINPLKASRLQLIFGNALFWDNYIYVYQIHNPDPISFKGGIFKPLMDAEVYKDRLNNKLVRDLNSIAMGGFKIPWKWLLIGGVGALIAIYLMGGGDIPGITTPINQPELVNTARTLFPLIVHSVHNKSK